MKNSLKTILTFPMAFLASVVFAFGQNQMTVDSVFAHYYDATGGEALWKNVKNYTMKRTYSSGSAAGYDSEIYVSMPEQAMSKSKIIMNRNFIYGVKGPQSWLKIPIGGSDKTTKYQVKDLSQSEQSAMRLEMYDLLAPFINYKDRALVATLVGTEKLNGKPVQHIELQGRGVKYNLYFDADTGLLVREKLTLDGVVTTTDFSDYKKSAYGIMYPATLVETNSKDNAKTTITSELTVNGTISPEYFQR